MPARGSPRGRHFYLRCRASDGTMRRMSRDHARRAFSLIEVLVVIGIIAILLGILLPALEHVRHQAYIADCASNLRQIGAALSSYCNENHGNYPRTRYVPGAPLVNGTGTTGPDPFSPTGPSPNDLTAPAF